MAQTNERITDKKLQTKKLQTRHKHLRRARDQQNTSHYYVQELQKKLQRKLLC